MMGPFETLLAEKEELIPTGDGGVAAFMDGRKMGTITPLPGGEFEVQFGNDGGIHTDLDSAKDQAFGRPQNATATEPVDAGFGMTEKGHFESMVEAEAITEGVAEIIRQQVKAMDFWAMARWGAKNFVKSDSGFNLPDVIGQIDEKPSHRKFGPGLQFDVRGSKLKRGGRVYIMLDRGRDLYTVLAGKIIRKDGSPTWVTTALSERVPVENLIDVIDGIV